MRYPSLRALALSLLLPPIAAPAAAQQAAAQQAAAQQAAAPSVAQIVACLEDRQRAGCAGILVRLMVCDQAPAIPGCAEINARHQAAVADIEPADIEPAGAGEGGDDDAEEAATGDADAPAAGEDPPAGD